MKKMERGKLLALRDRADRGARVTAEWASSLASSLGSNNRAAWQAARVSRGLDELVTAIRDEIETSWDV